MFTRSHPWSTPTPLSVALVAFLYIIGALTSALSALAAPRPRGFSFGLHYLHVVLLLHVTAARLCFCGALFGVVFSTCGWGGFPKIVAGLVYQVLCVYMKCVMWFARVGAALHYVLLS